jgi:hypothetical protein
LEISHVFYPPDSNKKNKCLDINTSENEEMGNEELSTLNPSVWLGT